ncbi:PREDICTED: uncharacterized protein LOC108555555 [Eufriesea mexicana]|uniref:uncharacterized protein LOC108555555 n=1 Tax=Eufriesea mexicana TaxID=516756 RepID=UPI00083C057E|nr:PREDICTED: uncharacterized protein LOC108555555 [Eufriesea mexicana]
MASNILDLLRNEGVLSSNLQEKLLSSIPDNAKEKLSNILQRYQELNKEEKQELVNGIVEKFTHSLRDKVQSSSSLYMQLFYSHSYMVFIFAVLFVVIILGTSFLRII